MRILLTLFVVIDDTTRKIQLERIDERSTIAQLKAKIRDQDNIPVEEQCLIFNDSELENGKTLKSYAVKDRSTLRLVRLTSTKITVFVIIDGTSRKFRLSLDASHTVNQMKAKIQEQDDIPADQQCLYSLKIFWRILENDKTLAYYGIKNRATILLVRHDSSDKANNAWKVDRDMASFGANVVAIGGPALSIVVFAHKCIKKKPENGDSKNDHSGNDNSPIRIDGNESDLVSKVKDMIGQNKGIPSEHHALYWEFKLLDDNRAMSDLNIKNGSVLLLVEKTFGKKLENQLFESALERKYIWNYFLEELQNGNFEENLMEQVSTIISPPIQDVLTESVEVFRIYCARARHRRVARRIVNPHSSGNSIGFGIGIVIAGGVLIAGVGLFLHLALYSPQFATEVVSNAALQIKMQ